MTSIPTKRSHMDRGLKKNLRCLHCGGATRVRSSRDVAETYRQLILACVDAECGATFGADLTLTHAISPSANPKAGVVLRQAPPRRRADNDGHPKQLTGPEVPAAPANDDTPVGETLAL